MKSKMSAVVDARAILLYLFLFTSNIDFGDAHGYMSTPRSRNVYAKEEGTNGSVPKVPKVEYCEACLNRKSADDHCGIGQSGSYDDYFDSQGNPMPWMSQETYDEGAIITVSGALTANHAGHIEVFACADPNPSTSCLRSNPLTMVKDLLYDGPNDKTYPGRGYVSPAYDFSFSYKLPSGLHGEKVIIQWHYITANSCHPPGYKDPAIDLAGRGWLRGPNLKACGDLDPTGVGLPEQFWNCAEVTILDNGSPTAPTTSSPTRLITKSPTKAPVPIPPTEPTTKAPTKSSKGYCSWSTPPCNGVDSSPWCSESYERCMQCSGGTWCGAKSTNAPVATPPSKGYCSWSSPICNGVDSSPWCSESYERCVQCKGTWCGGKSTNAPVATPPTSSPRMATTTRYWDCSGGACGCAYLPFPGQDDKPAMCYSNAMFKAPSNNPYRAKFYGTAAISQALGGGDWLAEGCGKCWKVTGKSNIAGFPSTETTLVLKGTNYCPPGNAMCAGNNAHFDISAPGFDVKEYSFANTCDEREPEEKVGFAACGRWLVDSNNPNENCDCSKFKDPVLRAGCENFFSLKWDNSPVAYEEVNCPAELSRLNCWEENGNDYPDDIPKFCASNIAFATKPPTATPSATPSAAPTSACSENASDKFLHAVNKKGKVKTKNCAWLQKKKSAAASKYCKKKVNVTEKYNSAQYTCRATCKSCDPCYQNDNSKFFYKLDKSGKALLKNCKWLNKLGNAKTICKSKASHEGYGPAKSVCPKVCNAACNV